MVEKLTKWQSGSKVEPPQERGWAAKNMARGMGLSSDYIPWVPDMELQDLVLALPGFGLVLV
jgi:hypothetical protein